MRRLIEWAYGLIFGLRVRTAEQHINDLELLLSGLLDDRADLEEEIAQVTERLLAAMQARDAHFYPPQRRQSDRVQTPASSLS